MSWSPRDDPRHVRRAVRYSSQRRRRRVPSSSFSFVFPRRCERETVSEFICSRVVRFPYSSGRRCDSEQQRGAGSVNTRGANRLSASPTRAFRDRDTQTLFFFSITLQNKKNRFVLFIYKTLSSLIGGKKKRNMNNLGNVESIRSSVWLGARELLNILDFHFRYKYISLFLFLSIGVSRWWAA